MKDEKKSPKKDEQIKDLPEQEVPKDASEGVKGGKAWDIPAGTASPSA